MIIIEPLLCKTSKNVEKHKPTSIWMV